MNTIWEDFEGKPRRKTRREMGYEQGFADAKAQFESKWIPVSERLPEDGEKVVVTLEDGDARTMTFYRSENDWWFETDEGWEYKAMARAWIPSYKESVEV